MSKVDTDEKKIDAILNRGVIAEVLPSSEELREKMLSGDKLRIYIGVDPTSNSLHLSHAKNYMVLEEFRKLGHEAIVLFGDFTARIGDPSDRSSTRDQLTKEDVQKNVTAWKKQIISLMDFDDKDNPPKIMYNDEWLSKLTMEDVVNLASNFTVQQMLERDMFEKRISNQKPIHLHEFLYPLMQGYDSVAMDVDIELCGTDQTFNALAGRTLLKKLKDKNKLVVTVNLMENPKTGELMSKSSGTGVFLDVPAKELFGSIMAQGDEMTKIFLINNTRLPLSEIDEIMDMGPKEAKMKTALEVTNIFHGAKVAQEAQNEFVRVFSSGELPEDILEFEVPQEGMTVEDLLTNSQTVSSKSEVRRLLEQGGIVVDDSKISDSKEMIKKGKVVKVGPRRFLKTK